MTSLPIERRFLFFLRAYNDVDNIAPAIYFLLEEEQNAEAHIVFYSFDYDYKDNPNLKYLQETFGPRIRIEWLGEKAGLNYDWLYNFGVLSRLYLLMNKLHPKHRISHLAAPTEKFDSDKRQKIIDSILADGPFPALVIFDQNRAHAVSGLTQALRNGGVRKIVSLPVSPFININILRAADFTTLDPAHYKLKHDYSHLDEVVQCDGFYAESLERFYQSFERPSPLNGKVQVLGSLRFCPEWIEIRRKIITPVRVETARRKTNMVFMLSNPATNTNWSEIKTTVKLLGEFPDIAVIVKPHTRSRNIDLGPLPDNVTVNFSAESSDLIDWADVVMFWGTSMALEAYMKDKCCICLNHVHANVNNYAQHNAGWVMNARDDLMAALIALQADPAAKPYDTSNIDRMLDNIVLGGDKKTTVPQKYIRYFQENSQ